MKFSVAQVFRWWKAVCPGGIVAESPMAIDGQSKRLAISLIKEECKELITAIENDDLCEIADGGCDLIWVVLECLLRHGIDPEPCWEEVARTNLAKLVDGKIIRREGDGKILKPEGWKPPNMMGVLIDQERLTVSYPG